MENKRGRIRRVNSRNTIIAFIATLSASLALAEDFKTVNGKEYKNATVTRVEADGIIVRTAGGISKVYFVELPKDVQERFGYNREARQQVAPKALMDRPAARSQPTANRPGCLDLATAKPAEDNAAASLDAAMKAAKNGDTATAASHMQS